jgi:hypothetical protein
MDAIKTSLYEWSDVITVMLVAFDCPIKRVIVLSKASIEHCKLLRSRKKLTGPRTSELHFEHRSSGFRAILFEATYRGKRTDILHDAGDESAV